MSPNPRSKFEAKILADLSQLDAEYVYEDPESWIAFTQPAKSRRYLPDITLKTKSGKTIYIEVKGKLDVDTRHKMEWVKEQHPDKDIRIIFMRNNRLSKNTKIKTYVDWAESKGFRCAVGAPPAEWLVE